MYAVGCCYIKVEASTIFSSSRHKNICFSGGGGNIRSSASLAWRRCRPRLVPAHSSEFPVVVCEKPGRTMFVSPPLVDGCLPAKRNVGRLRQSRCCSARRLVPFVLHAAESCRQTQALLRLLSPRYRWGARYETGIHSPYLSDRKFGTYICNEVSHLLRLYHGCKPHPGILAPSGLLYLQRGSARNFQIVFPLLFSRTKM